MRVCPLILCLLAASTAAFAQPAEVNRVLHTFDFEERRLGNAEDLPMNWSKVEGSGLPHYVNGRLTTDRARSGKYSFRFDLNGGSLVYRYDAGKIPVKPGAHYRVEGYVQTTKLANARARLTAYFVNPDGVPIKGTTHYSELYASRTGADEWQRLWVELSADAAGAHSLVVELSLLQPTMYAANTLGGRTLFTQDIRGSAWFDDITVSQVPRVVISTDRPGNIFRRGEALRLQVVVSDRFTDDLAARLLVHDALGKGVHQRSGALEIASAEAMGPGKKRLWVTLPELPPGWYEVSLVMTSRGQYLGDQTLDFVLLADNAPPVVPDSRFGVVATDLPFDGWSELPEILPLLGTGRVKLAVWNAHTDIEELDSAKFDTILVRLQEQRITPTACLIDLPPSIAQRLTARQKMVEAAQAFAGAARPAAPETNWPHLLKASPDDWQPQLAQLIARHANHLDRWQLGADGSEAFVTDGAMRDVYDKVYQEFASLVFKPDLAMPWPAWYELDGRLPATVALSVSPSVLPHQLPLYMQDIKGKEGHNLSINLQPLDRRQYGREVQIRDFAQRVVYALAADAKRIDVPLPFSVKRAGGGNEASLESVDKQPQEMLMIVRTLITTLGGAAFKGKVPIAEDVEAFLFDRNGQGILVLWDRGSTAGVKQLAINLGERPLQLDLWGNPIPLLTGEDGRTNGKTPVALGPMPVLLVDIDASIAMLRASVAIDRPLIESSFQPHTRRLRFSNPYKIAITGSLRLKGPLGWVINPPTHTFSLNPGETFDRELTIEFPYNSYAGARVITAEFAVQADKTSTFSVPITLQLGLSDIGMQTLALRDGNDVIVQQVIQNYGELPINYSSFAIFPGQARQERLITNLAPGRTTLKRYRFTDVKIAPGIKIRVGVKELNGSRILNDEVEIQ
jgi:hypothetical protein